MNPETIINILYPICGFISIAAYAPTIQELLKGEPSASKRSYFIWSVTSLVSLLYGLLIVKDLKLNIIFALNFLACSTIFLLRLRIKDKP